MITIEAQLAAFRDGSAVQSIGAEDEWPRPIAKSAGSPSKVAPRFEQAGISRRRCGIAQNPPQSAANHIAAFAGGKVDPSQRAEVESKAKELEFGLQIPP